MRRQITLAAFTGALGLSADSVLACSDSGEMQMVMSTLPGGGIIGGGVVFVLPLLLGTIKGWFARAGGMKEYAWPRSVLASYLSTLALTIGGVFCIVIPPLMLAWFPISIIVSSSIEHQFLNRYVEPIEVAPVEVNTGWTDEKHTLSYARPIQKPIAGLKYHWILIGNLVTTIGLPMLIPLMESLNLNTSLHHYWARQHIEIATVVAMVIGIVGFDLGQPCQPTTN